MTKFSNLAVGNVLSETTFYTVSKIKGDQAELKTSSGVDVVLDKGYIEGLLDSGDQFTKEEKISKTDAANLLLKSSGVVLTVNFNKQVKEADVVSEIIDAYENSTPKDFATKLKKAVKKGLEGEPRTLRGYHYGNQDEYGRLHVYDLDIPLDPSKSYNTSQRLIDTRTISWLIVRGVKYTVK